MKIVIFESDKTITRLIVDHIKKELEASMELQFETNPPTLPNDADLVIVDIEYDDEEKRKGFARQARDQNREVIILTDIYSLKDWAGKIGADFLEKPNELSLFGKTVREAAYPFLQAASM